MALFVSTFINKVDRKGRVSVPAQFRAALGSPTQQSLVIYPSFTLPAIEGCGIDFLERLAESSSTSYDVFSTEQDDLNTLIFATSHQLAWDPEGRIILPEDILAHAGITEQVAFVGKGRTFQLWEPAAHEEHKAQARARALEKRPKIALRPAPGVEGL
jgi:MraZ protein